MSEVGFLRGAARAFGAVPLLLVAATTLVLTIGRLGGLIGLPALLIGTWWVWIYAYLLVTATAHGQPLPVLAVEHANPWHEPRPLLFLALAAAVAGFGWWLQQRLGLWVAYAIAALALLAFPGAFALLAVEGQPLRAASPPAIARVAAGLGVRYLWLLGLGALYVALATALAPLLPPYALLAVGQLLLFSFCTALGSALYARRLELGLEAWHTPERDAARAARASERERDALAAELYGLIRARHPEVAWQRASAWLAGGDRAPETYRWLRDRALGWGEARFADRLGEELVARLIALGRRGEALEEVEACWRRGGRYAPGDFRDRDVLERVARELGRDATHARLRAESAAPR